MKITKDELLDKIHEYIDKGNRCMDQCEEDNDGYSFWDGFHNCARAIYLEILDIPE